MIHLDPRLPPEGIGRGLFRLLAVVALVVGLCLILDA